MVSSSQKKSAGPFHLFQGPAHIKIDTLVFCRFTEIPQQDKPICAVSSNPALARAASGGRRVRASSRAGRQRCERGPFAEQPAGFPIRPPGIAGLPPRQPPAPETAPAPHHGAVPVHQGEAAAAFPPTRRRCAPAGSASPACWPRGAGVALPKHCGGVLGVILVKALYRHCASPPFSGEIICLIKAMRSQPDASVTVLEPTLKIEIPFRSISARKAFTSSLS